MFGESMTCALDRSLLQFRRRESGLVAFSFLLEDITDTSFKLNLRVLPIGSFARIFALLTRMYQRCSCQLRLSLLTEVKFGDIIVHLTGTFNVPKLGARLPQRVSSFDMRYQ